METNQESKNVNSAGFTKWEKLYIFSPPILCILAALVIYMILLYENLPILFGYSIIFWLLCLIPAIIAYIFYSAQQDYDQIPYADLRAERDEYTIFGGILSLFAAFSKLQDIILKVIPAEYLLLGLGVLAYMLLLIGVHYRRLSAAMYRHEEAAKKQSQEYHITIEKK